MDLNLKKEIIQLNPWLYDDSYKKRIIEDKNFIYRKQIDQLLNPEWDILWTILTGPRRAGKTTIGKFLFL